MSQVTGHALMDLVISNIETRAYRWNQSAYAYRSECGTAYCMAGIACMLHGFEPAFRDDNDVAFYLEDGRIIDDVARELFGITVRQARALFDSSNTLGDLKEIVAEIKSGNL